MIKCRNCGKDGRRVNKSDANAGHYSVVYHTDGKICVETPNR